MLFEVLRLRSRVPTLVRYFEISKSIPCASVDVARRQLIPSVQQRHLLATLAKVSAQPLVRGQRVLDRARGRVVRSRTCSVARPLGSHKTNSWSTLIIRCSPTAEASRLARRRQLDPSQRSS